MCVPLPMPAEAKLIWPGLDFASSIRSSTDFRFRATAMTTSTFGWPANGMISTKSLSVLNGRSG